VAYSNLNVSYHVNPSAEVYVNVQNVFDTKPPPYAPLPVASAFSSGAGAQGVGFYPADDAIGRYFVVGARMRF
jgi:outer membrane receptor protein involved in Fe transport